jgi:phospholipid N-methyltransferase
LDRIDLMVCCLALPYIPRRAVAGIFGAFAALGVNGWFTQQTLVPLVYRRMYTRLFQQVHFRPVARNLPPGGVYHCHGLRANYHQNLPGKR